MRSQFLKSTAFRNVTFITKPTNPRRANGSTWMQVGKLPLPIFVFDSTTNTQVLKKGGIGYV